MYPIFYAICIGIVISSIFGWFTRNFGEDLADGAVKSINFFAKYGKGILIAFVVGFVSFVFIVTCFQSL